MAIIPTDTPTVDDSGLVGGTNVTLNETVSAVNKNEPLFSVGNPQLAGYIALELYEQHQASVVGGGSSTGQYDLFSGSSYASGKPFVIAESVWATDVING